MTHASKPCGDCGEMTDHRHKRTGRPCCVPCGIVSAAKAAREMAAKSGPAWDAYVASGQVSGTRNVPRDSRGRYVRGQAHG